MDCVKDCMINCGVAKDLCQNREAWEKKLTVPNIWKKVKGNREIKFVFNVPFHLSGFPIKGPAV